MSDEADLLGDLGIPLDGTTAAEPSAAEDSTSRTIGRYKLLERLGEGGCGVVYVAEQTEPVRRRVALKVIKLGMDTKQVVARFEAERQALAMMDHPNIAKVLDAGTTPTGRPYFVMELVRGIEIAEYCDQANLGVRERLDLFVKVCQAIQHAHQKGIIHRDIKPSNILVTLHDGVAVPKVIDFGIAKATEGRLTDATVYTQLHQFIGTPAFMSPEQAEMSGLDIDTRSDIYSMGVLLYVLLTGKTPFESKDLIALGIDEMRRTIRETEPMRPSTRFAALKGEELTTTARRRSIEVPRLIHLLKGDLDWVVMKCLEKDRSRRYESASGLAADVQRYLDNEPVVARPPSAVYRIGKMVKRNRLLFAAAAIVIASLVGGIGVSIWMVREARMARDLAIQERDRADQAKRIADQKTEQAAKANAETQKYQAAEDARLYLKGTANLVGILSSSRSLNSRMASTILKELDPKPGHSDLRGWEYRYLWGLERGNVSYTLAASKEGLAGFAISPSGKQIGIVEKSHSGKDGQGNVLLWDLDTREQIGQPLSNQGSGEVVFSPDGLLLAFSSSDKRVRVVELATRKELVSLQIEGDPEGEKERRMATPFSRRSGGAMAFSPQSDTLAIASGRDGRIGVFDLKSGKQIALLRGHNDPVKSLVFFPDGRRLVSSCGEPKVIVWDISASRSEREYSERMPRNVAQVAVSDDGKRLSWTDVGGKLSVYTVDESGSLSFARSKQFVNFYEGAVFSPDGKTFCAYKHDIASIYDAFTLEEQWTLRGADSILQVAYSPDGTRFIAASTDGAINIWNRAQLEGDAESIPNPPDHWISQLSAGARWLFRAQQNHNYQVIEVSDRRNVHSGNLSAIPTSSTISSIAIHPNGIRGAFATQDGTVWVLDLRDGAQLGKLGGLNAPVHCQFSEDGKVLVGSDSEQMVVWSSSNLKEVVRKRLRSSDFPANGSFFRPDGIECLALSQDGAMALSAFRDGMTVFTSTVQAGELSQHHPLNRPLSGVRAAFSPDKNYLVAVVAGDSGVIQVFDSGAKSLSAFPGEEGFYDGYEAVQFSPDVSRLIAVTTTSPFPHFERKRLVFFDGRSFEHRAGLRINDTAIQELRFTDGGNTIAALGKQALHFWKAPSWEYIERVEKETRGKESPGAGEDPVDKPTKTPSAAKP